MPAHYGATPEEWVTFDLLLGLAADLLPVVSNPQAVISPTSTLRGKGKVPSRYNAQHEVVGFHQWTSYHATDNDITKWSKEKDYGICLQTRHVRALDIDNEDHEKSGQIVLFLQSWLTGRMGYPFPVRHRSNSAKCLLACKIPGEFSKRILKVDGGIIEFLATGQQFIAAGTHPSGARYEWEGLTDFPPLSADEFELLWSELVAKFGIAIPTREQARKHGEDIGLPDDTIDKLTVLSWGPQGQAHIVCPFASEHTSDTGESSTSYFPAGTRGYEQGHFVCLHAHCAHRTNDDFLDALGIQSVVFEPVVEEIEPEAKAKEKLPAPWPKFKRTAAGEIYPVIANLYEALKRDDVCNARIAYDSFRDEIVITSHKSDALSWRALGDNDYTLLQRHLECDIGFKPIALDLLRRTVQAVAYEHSFDSAKLWLDSLAWDGKPRVDKFLAQYMSAESNAYSRAVSRYIWTALAGRVVVPGVKADMIPIFEGRQGSYKSSTVAAMAPQPEFFCKISFDDKEDNLSRKIKGRLIAEIAELRGLKTKALEAIKDFVSSTHETWVPKWKEHTMTFARRLLFIATTNDTEVLDDDSGHRRWLPVHVDTADIEAIQRDRDQLWAEGKELFAKHGVCWQEAESLACGVHGDYLVLDVWERVICDWLETKDGFAETLPATKGYITIEEVMREALHIEARNMKGADSKRVGKALRKLGFERGKMRFGKATEWVWRVPGYELL